MSKIARILSRIPRVRNFSSSAQLAHQRDSGLVKIGRGTYGIPRINFYAGQQGSVEIGNYCSIADGVLIICGGEHPTDRLSTYPFSVEYPGSGDPACWTKKLAQVSIGHDVWLGTRATIVGAVSIGSGSIVAAGAVVTKDVPPYAIVGGVPAAVLRFRFPPETIKRLLALEWWNWDHQHILEQSSFLGSVSTENCLERLEAIRRDTIVE